MTELPEYLSYNLTALALPVFFVLIVLEIFLSARRGRQAYNVKDFWGSMSQLAGNIVVQLAAKGLILGLYYWLYSYRLWTVPTTILGLIGLAIAIDFVYYWYHRASHRIRILWAVHVAHHSSEYMNLGTALRQSWFGPLTKPLFYWTLPLIGFHPLAIMGIGALLTIYGFWTHTEQVRRLGVLEHILVTPSHHRVHHGANPIYVDKNYSNFLIIWDKLFGTFQAESEPVRYGLTQNIKNFNPLVIAFHEFGNVARRLLNAENWAMRSQALFGPPEQSETKRS